MLVLCVVLAALLPAACIATPRPVDNNSLDNDNGVPPYIYVNGQQAGAIYHPPSTESHLPKECAECCQRVADKEDTMNDDCMDKCPWVLDKRDVTTKHSITIPNQGTGIVNRRNWDDIVRPPAWRRRENKQACKRAHHQDLLFQDIHQTQR